ncbi:MAG: hypothetical protein K5657_02495 [Desulfovibrio sp.]|nr:hypothetical protein [Desulfovibrio sp.]
MNTTRHAIFFPATLLFFVMLCLLLVVAPAWSIAEGDSIPLFAELAPWYENLPPEKQAKAFAILKEGETRILKQRASLHQKITQLRSLRYVKGSSPLALPKLGQELQENRKALEEEIRRLQERLAAEVGSAPTLSARGHSQAEVPAD